MPSPASRRSLRRPLIIAALLGAAMVLSGCGAAVKIGYGQGSALAFRWLDGYVDFNDAQSLQVRTALDEWFRWNRRTQLTDYANLLGSAATELPGNITPERMCGFFGEVRTRFDAGLEHAMPTLVELAPTFSAQQIANVEKKYADRNESYRDDFIQRDLVKRKKVSVEREVDRAQDFYGSLDRAQKDMITRSVADSPYDAELTYAERLRRQQDIVAMLRRLAAARAARSDTRADAEAELKGFVQRLDKSPREDYRRYSVKLTDYNCAFASTLHNATSAEQRRHAVKKVREFEADLRSLAADGAG